VGGVESDLIASGEHVGRHVGEHDPSGSELMFVVNEVGVAEVVGDNLVEVVGLCD
jgi:hypothetical protein